MFRRRQRPRREIAFSFESFLDIVANVVGIIIRLILVAWMGARTYQAVIPLPPLPALPVYADPQPLPDPIDPRLDQIARRRTELAGEKQVAMAEHQRKDNETQEEIDRLHLEIEEIEAARMQLKEQGGELTSDAASRGAKVKSAMLSIEELQKRSRKLADELKKANKPVVPKNKLHYRAPVSAAVQTEEVMFECKGGRVTLLDTQALLGEVQRVVRAKGEKLRDRWEVSEETEAVGAFRLRYVVTREKSALDRLNSGKPIEGGYSYGVSEWEAVPVTEVRGEDADKALAAGSEFRRVIDALDAQQTVVTLWVYTDSFGLYRSLRDYLHGRELVVAGRPLPEGMAIASSRKGTASRGQ